MLHRYLNPCALCIFALVGSCFGVNDSLYFLFQRSTYLESLFMPGAWWANPAVTAEISSKTALTVNVTPLGNTYTIASAKYLAPAANAFGWGIGVMGAGINPNPDGSLQANNDGAQYSSHFTFSNPSIQCAAGAKMPGIGAAGLLGDFGFELLPDGNGGQANFWTMGIGAGLLTPYYFNNVSLSISVMSTGHFWIESFWDNDGKLGARFKTPDSLLMGSLEYTVSFVSGSVKYIGNAPAYYYQVVKGLASLKAYAVLGVLMGFSRDLGIYSDNGSMVHAGLELRQSTVYPFFGGYEVGVSLTHSALLVHRLWLAYCFRQRK
jgi:hypothetical protein